MVLRESVDLNYLVYSYKTCQCQHLNFKVFPFGSSLVAKWLGYWAFTAMARVQSIPGPETEIPDGWVQQPKKSFPLFVLPHTLTAEMTKSLLSVVV